MAQAKTLEESLEQLDEIIEKMDSDDVSLEEAFKLYNQGLKLCKTCNDKIEKVEKQLEIMNESDV